MGCSFLFIRASTDGNRCCSYSTPHVCLLVRISHASNDERSKLTPLSDLLRRRLRKRHHHPRELLPNAQGLAPDLPPCLLPSLTPPQWLYISSLVYCPTAFFTKVTLLLLIARVFTVRTGVTYAIYAFILVLALAYIPIEIAKIDICNPIQSYWNPAVDGRCLDQRKIFLADLGVAITTDFVILVVPIPLTWKMRTGWQKKLKIVGMLGAGGSALGVTIYRLVLVIKSTNTEGQAHSDFILLDLLQ